MNKKNLCLRVHRWALFLAPFKYTIEHRPGRFMTHVDALSRNPLPEVMLIEECGNNVIARLIRAHREDESLRDLLKFTENEEKDDFTMKNGLLCKIINDYVLIVVPKSMQSQVVRQAHERGHFAINKTEAILKREYWFKGIRSKVEKIVRNCINCILAERKQGKQEGLLNSIEKDECRLENFSCGSPRYSSIYKEKLQSHFRCDRRFYKVRMALCNKIYKHRRSYSTFKKAVHDFWKSSKIHIGQTNGLHVTRIPRILLRRKDCSNTCYHSCATRQRSSRED